MNIKTFEELLKISNQTNKKIFEVAQELEAKNLEISVEEVRKKVKINLTTMKEAIQRGLNSNELSASRMCGVDCAKLKNTYQEKKIIFSEPLQKTLLYALATAEENARMGKIAACPTAGACGIIPAALLSISESINADEEKEINALITAGITGEIISQKMALAGAVMGCQGECGVAAAMAAASIAELLNGTSEQILNAAALTLKNIMGLVCDPVAGLVEVPCVKRNPFLAINAVTGAELALSGVESIIPLDEIIDAVKQVGQLMSVSLKESSEAGLATTKTGLQISEKLKKMYDF